MTRYHELLCEQLEVVGASALAMLQGTAPLDETIVLAAAEAVGLLKATTLGTPELITLHRELAQALRTSPPLESLSLSGWSWSPDPDEQVLQVNQLVALGGLAASLLPPQHDTIAALLSSIEAEILLWPERAAGQSPLADRLRAELDLDDAHPLSGVLQTLSDAAALAAAPAPDDAALLAVLEQARRRIFVPQRVGWLRLLGDSDFSQSVEQYVQLPERAAASSGEGPMSLPPPRKALYRRNEQEINLLPHRDSMILEWFSEVVPAPEKAFLLPEGRELEPCPAPEGMDEGRYWSLPPLPEEPGAEPLRVVLTGAAGRLEVELVPE